MQPLDETLADDVEDNNQPSHIAETPQPISLNFEGRSFYDSTDEPFSSPEIEPFQNNEAKPENATHNKDLDLPDIFANCNAAADASLRDEEIEDVNMEMFEGCS
ncbi:uncharacterized protein B0T23DRAFT_386303 [Neurospora hispaniola]|uniref:Uncharacterized protein n=1 Tax=Neurospora hispaniola TaxID=588809 RepID=A0AAJ0I1X0_9PEZI|nr:hypothetical protein B0T23DRAFT_386303 [Neurospora hispaniola]